MLHAFVIFAQLCLLCSLKSPILLVLLRKKKQLCYLYALLKRAQLGRNNCEHNGNKHGNSTRLFSLKKKTVRASQRQPKNTPHLLLSLRQGLTSLLVRALFSPPLPRSLERSANCTASSACTRSPGNIQENSMRVAFLRTPSAPGSCAQTVSIYGEANPEMIEANPEVIEANPEGSGQDRC